LSHVASIELEIRDLEALGKAAKSLGLELVRNQKTYRWFGRSVGDSRAYEIGVVKRRDGRPGYTLLWDFWSRGMGMQDVVGDDGNKLKQAYSTQVTKSYWQKKGYRVSETRKEDGSVLIRATRA
jgi:hypothetical protein